MIETGLHREGSHWVAIVDLAVYGLESVLKSAYRFTDRCYLQVQMAGTEQVAIRLRLKREGDSETAAREFWNDLLDQRLRQLISTETAKTRDLIMAHALSRTGFIRPDLESMDPASDPHHVATPDKQHAQT